MINKIDSTTNFNGRITTDIVLNNAKQAKRLENIINTYALRTADKPKKNIHISEAYNTYADTTQLNIYGKDMLTTNNSITECMENMSDDQIVNKLIKIAGYLQIKFFRNKAYSRLTNKIMELEGKTKVNEKKAKTLFEHGKEKFAIQFAKLAELNKKNAERLRDEKAKMMSETDAKMKTVADGDSDILEDMLIY